VPLNGPQTSKLADVIGRELPPAALDLIATDLGVKLSHLLPGASVKEWAVKLIEELQRRMPPEDGTLLEVLKQHKNQTLSAAAHKLLQPDFLSPTDDPHDAIVLGGIAFVARDQLRRALRMFTHPNRFTTRVLIVRGEEPGGKSYSWEFLRHLAFASVGATARRLPLKGTSYSPRAFLVQVYNLLLLPDLVTLPTMADDPQLMKIDPLMNHFKGRLDLLSKRYWLVIDDLNHDSVTPEIRAIAYAVACAVEELKPDNLWVVLLGYNTPVVDLDLNRAESDDAVFPSARSVAEHFEAVARFSGKLFPSARAREIADVMFSEFPKLDKEAMSKLTQRVEKMDERLRVGQQP